MKKLLEIMRALRDPLNGCEWDRAQTFASIAPYTIEEAYEVAEAIDQGDLAALQGELGDLLFQVVFYAQLASEQNAFEFADVVSGISDKLVRRHPHVFADQRYGDETERKAAWENHKLAEQRAANPADRSILAGVPTAMPALTRAAKLGKRAASQGFDWDGTAGVLAKVVEEAGELTQAAAAADKDRIREEYGDLLLAMSSLGRHLGADPEESLRQANNKFERRVRAMEGLMRQDGKGWSDYDAVGLDRLWVLAKQDKK